MTPQQSEFVVNGLVRGNELLEAPYLVIEGHAVEGRCGNLIGHGGDHFRHATCIDEPEYSHGYEKEPVELDRQDIDLVVRGAYSYDQERAPLDRGMTGRLFLTGEGPGRIETGHVLCGAGTDCVGADGVKAGAEPT